MKILITGSKGQLGSEFVELSKALNKFEFFFTDKEELDITKSNQIEDFCILNKIDAIINCAAYTAVDTAEDECELADLINAIAVSNIVNVVEKLSLKLIHISTDYVFDGNSSVPYKEEDIVNPTSIYGISKLNGENHVINSDSNSIVIRTSWVYSSFGNNFVKTILRIAREREKLGIIFDQIGTPTYARDLASVCVKIIGAENLVLDNQKIYHYSNEGAISWYDFAKSICELSNIDCVISPIETHQYPTKAKRPNYSVLNKSKIKESFDIEIPYWKDSLKKCLGIINNHFLK